MSDNTNNNFVIPIILLSFLFASILNLYPLSASISFIRPMVLIMTLIFWVIFQPKLVGLFTAFFVGLLADLMLDTRLGHQAFCAVVVVFYVRLLSGYIKNLTFSRSWLLATSCLLVFQLTLWLLQYVTQSLFIPHYGLSLSVSILCWPILLLLFNKYTQPS